MSCLSHRCSVSLSNKSVPLSVHSLFHLSSGLRHVPSCVSILDTLDTLDTFSTFSTLSYPVCPVPPPCGCGRSAATPRWIFDVFFVLLAFLFCCLSVLLRPIRSDGGSRLWWVCLRVNTDYRHWVSDLRSPPVSGSGFVFSPSLWLGLASPQWSPCRPPLFPAAPFRRLGSLCPLPFRIEPN